MHLIYWSVRSSRRRKGDWVNVLNGGYHFFSLLGLSLIRVHENLVQHPIKYISIVATLYSYSSKLYFTPIEDINRVFKG